MEIYKKETRAEQKAAQIHEWLLRLSFWLRLLTTASIQWIPTVSLSYADMAVTCVDWSGAVD
jgi:hypothetical protein